MLLVMNLKWSFRYTLLVFGSWLPLEGMAFGVYRWKRRTIALYLNFKGNSCPLIGIYKMEVQPSLKNLFLLDMLSRNLVPFCLSSFSLSIDKLLPCLLFMLSSSWMSVGIDRICWMKDLAVKLLFVLSSMDLLVFSCHFLT